MANLTSRQRQIWRFLIEYADRHGYPPTVREIGEAVGLASPSTVHAHLANLERAGLLRRDSSKPRAIELVGRDASAQPASSDIVMEVGYERDRIGAAGSLDIRWWFFLEIPGAHLRNQRARRGVVDRGFRFARGGRAVTDDEARRAIEDAYAKARREADYWHGQPSHALGGGGELIPLDDLVIPELPA